ATELPLDCHLMIENPDQFIPEFAAAGANWISVHQEACVHLNRTLHLIKSHDCLAGVVINPATPVDTLTEVLDLADYILVMSVNPGFGAQKFIPGAVHKIRHLADLRVQRGLGYRIEVDGGVDFTTVADVVRAGAEILVAGNTILDRKSTRLNSSHQIISYAVFCSKKKTAAGAELAVEATRCSVRKGQPVEYVHMLRGWKATEH